MSVQHQVHEQFKVFAGPDIASIDSQIRAFTANGGVAAKSIGIGHVEGGDTLVVSLGYRTDVPGYPVKLTTKQVGAFDHGSPASIAALEGALNVHAGGEDDVICHELFISGGSVNLVMMTLA
ncbi:MAG TPA: hypothetical protein VKT78_16455 [Fimbriimonadaceae bacterium]|nr:hypothetical protein [Fimbriimonadaceae bacterium]